VAPVRSCLGLVASVAVTAMALAACVPNGFGVGSCVSTPPASIAFSGPTPGGAMEGATYFQGLTAVSGTMLGISHSIEPVELPAGASAGGNGVTWTVPPGMAGTTQHFHVRSDRDLCGQAAELAWSVTVYPPIEITGLEASPPVVSVRGTAVRVLATFTGGEGVLWAPSPVSITSGVPLDVGVLTQTTTFDLQVVSPAGASLHRPLTVVAQSPPVISSPAFLPPVATAGSQVELSWRLDGSVTSLTLEPGGISLSPQASFAYVLATPGVTYALAARNDVGDEAAATFSPVVVPAG
jgi:hypothetical protein